MSAEAQHSLQRLAWALRIPLGHLRRLAGARDQDLYRPFWLARPGKKPRLIDNPSDALKLVQRRIRQVILEPLPLPTWMFGCVTGKGAFGNAGVHKGQPNLTRIDVKGFYPSVTNRMVYQVFVRSGYGPEPARLLTRLTTRSGHLPQGSPTSDRLANLHLATIAPQLEAIFSGFGLRYSAYVDDVAFSGERTREAIGPVIEALRGIGLPVGHSKSGNAGPTRGHELTGFLTNSPHGPTLRRRDRGAIRAAVHHLIRERRQGPVAAKRELYVRSRLGVLRATSPGQAERLAHQLRRNGIDLSPKSHRKPQIQPAGSPRHRL